MRGQRPGLLQKLGPRDAYGTPNGLALFYVVCGDIDNAADSVAKAIEQGDPDMMVIPNLAVFRGLRSSPRWPALAKLMNLPETAS